MSRRRIHIKLERLVRANERLLRLISITFPAALIQAPAIHAQAVSPNAVVTPVSKNDSTDAGEPITYPTGSPPEVSSVIVTIPPGGKTDWMTHPVPGYLYVLEGTLTVEFEDGHHLTFHAGQAVCCRHEQNGIEALIKEQKRIGFWQSSLEQRGFQSS
jgi:quercetin dioxygenase-like cupin family protein